MLGLVPSISVRDERELSLRGINRDSRDALRLPENDDRGGQGDCPAAAITLFVYVIPYQRHARAACVHR